MMMQQNRDAEQIRMPEPEGDEEIHYNNQNDGILKPE